MHEFEYLKRKKAGKEFVQEQLQIEAPLPPVSQAEKKDDQRQERGSVIIDIWK